MRFVVVVADSLGQTALGDALRGGYSETAEALLKGGAVGDSLVRFCLSLVQIICWSWLLKVKTVKWH
jgi:hypothetical protein